MSNVDLFVYGVLLKDGHFTCILPVVQYPIPTGHHVPPGHHVPTAHHVPIAHHVPTSHHVPTAHHVPTSHSEYRAVYCH